MTSAAKQGAAGGRLVVAAALAVGALVTAVLSTPSSGAAELRATIRLTALTSSALFLAAFTASALQLRWPGPLTRWLVVNRRYLGLSFAASHLLHGIMIVTLARRLPEFWAQTQAATLVGGGLGFAFVAAMAATSNDRAVALLGPRAWRALHVTGLYYLWFVFTFTYAGAAARSPFHAAMVAVFVVALALRLTARDRPEISSRVGNRTARMLPGA